MTWIRNKNRKRSQMNENNAISLFSNVSDFLSVFCIVRYVKIKSFDCPIVNMIFFFCGLSRSRCVSLISWLKRQHLYLSLLYSLARWIDFIIQFSFFVWKFKGIFAAIILFWLLFLSAQQFRVNCNKCRMKLQFWIWKGANIVAKATSQNILHKLLEFILAREKFISSQKASI